jgi:phosphatidylglycerol:prolipoprotein diacylglycerol transferase
MYPVLWRLPLPTWALPLSPALVVLAGVGVLLVLLGWRYRSTELTLIGGLGALGGSGAAIAFKGQLTTLTELPVTSYGAMLCLALLVGWYLTMSLGQRAGLPRDLIASCFFVAALSGFVGARALYVLTNWGEIASLGDAVNARRGGLTGYGALVGGFLGSLWLLHRRKHSIWAWVDVVTPSLAVGVVLVRLGCYLLGSDFGQPLGVGAPEWLKRLGTFPHWSAQTFDGTGAPAWVLHVSRGLIALDAERSLPVHPTELYEALAGLGLVGLCVIGRRWQKGQLFCAWVFAYGVVRWVIDAWRDDPEQGCVGPFLALHHYLPLGLLALALAWAAGPAEVIARPRVRRAAQASGLLPAIVAYWLLVPPTFASAASVQVSISQWIGSVTALLGAVAYRWLPVGLGAPASVQGPAEDAEPSEPRASGAAERRNKPRQRRSRSAG